MKRAVEIDRRPIELRIVESLESKPGSFDDLEKRFDGQWCPVNEERVNQVGRLAIETVVSKLLKREVLGVQNKVFFVREAEPKAFGELPYKSTSRPRKEHPRQTRIPGT